MAFTPAMIPYMVGGYAVDKMMGGTGMTGAMLGTGLGGAGGFGGLAGELGLSGVSSLPSATAANSLGAGSGLIGGAGTSVGNAIGTGIGTSIPATSGGYSSLLGGDTILQPASMGMDYNLASGLDTAIQPNLIASNSYQPLGDGIAPDMSFKQQYIDMTPDVGINRTGTAQTPDYVGAINTSDVSKQGLTNQEAFGYSDGIANPQSPNFSNVTKSTAEELALAQGGYQKPLYERAFDSVVGYAEKNPVSVASLGLTALQAAEGPKQTPPDSSFARSAGVIKQAYSPTREPMLKVRRA